MLCSHARKCLHRYAAGEVKELERFLIKEHLDSCPSCKSEYERIVEIKHILSDMEKKVEAPSGLIADIMDSIDLQKYKSIGIYAINNIRSLGASLIAAGLIISVFSFYPQTEQTLDARLTGRCMAKIHESLIKPFEIINNSVIDISDMILNINEAICIDNE